MKKYLKIFLMTTLLLVAACSKDDDDSGIVPDNSNGSIKDSYPREQEENPKIRSKTLTIRKNPPKTILPKTPKKRKV